MRLIENKSDVVGDEKTREKDAQNDLGRHLFGIPHTYHLPIHQVYSDAQSNNDRELEERERESEQSDSVDRIRKIANLARLELTPEEEEVYGSQLARVVDYIELLREYSAHSESQPKESQPEAADEPRPKGDVAWFLENAPQSLDRFLMVPQVKADSD